jgi:hypothetical protein
VARERESAEMGGDECQRATRGMGVSSRVLERRKEEGLEETQRRVWALVAAARRGQSGLLRGGGGSSWRFAESPRATIVPRGLWGQMMSRLGFPTSLCVHRIRSATLSKDARSVVQSSGSHRPRCCNIVGEVRHEACVSIDAIDTTAAFGAHLDDGLVLGALDGSQRGDEDR